MHAPTCWDPRQQASKQTRWRQTDRHQHTLLPPPPPHRTPPGRHIRHTRAFCVPAGKQPAHPSRHDTTQAALRNLGTSPCKACNCNPLEAANNRDRALQA